MTINENKMKPLVVRGMPVWLLLFCSLFSIGFMCFSLFTYYLLAIEPGPLGVCIFVTVAATFFFLIPGFVFLMYCILIFLQKVTIYDNAIMWIKPLRKAKTIRANQLTFWGCVAYAPRSTRIFFCTLDKDTRMEELNAHWEKCVKLYGKDQIEQLRDREDGMLQLALGTYLYRFWNRHNDNILFLDYTSGHRLKSIVNALKRDALVIGPWSMKFPHSWEPHSKYK